MNKDKLILPLAISLFVLVAAALAMDIHFYGAIKKISAEADQQKKLTAKNFEDAFDKISVFRADLDGLKAELSSQGKTLIVLSDKMGAGDAKLNAVLSEIKDIDKNMKDWQKDYLAALMSFEEKTNSFRSDLKELKEAVTKNPAREEAGKTQTIEPLPHQ